MGDLIEEGEVRDMTPRLVGETYLRKPSENSKSRKRYGIFECAYCDKHWECNSSLIKTGRTKSCGCQKINTLGITHGLKSNKYYQTWCDMINRCNNPKNKAYKDYGGRGIIVCEEWLDVRNFVAWCDLTHPNIEGLSLDRIDNDKGYSPENCRWADASTQALNKRMMKSNTSGYIGVSWKKDKNIWTIRIKVNTKYVWLGDFNELMEAVIFRDHYIIENKLPHKLNLKQEKPNE